MPWSNLWTTPAISCRRCIDDADVLRTGGRCFFPDGTTLISPDNRSLAEKVGLRTRASERFYDLIVVGAGPAGLGAAVYGGSEGLRTAMIERQATGGQAGTSSLIENYLGFPKGLSGADLARRATAEFAGRRSASASRY